MQNNLGRKGLAVGIILLFVGIAVTPTTGISYKRDDTIPPVTTISFNPPEPDGENGWYISNVTVILNATDDSSGVNITKYSIDEAPWETYTEPFILNKDGDDLLIEFFSIDNAGNTEPVKNATINIDQTKPVMWLWYNVTDGGNAWCGWNLTFYVKAIDSMSGMNRAEFFKDDELQETVTGPGPFYEWVFHFIIFYAFHVRGLIRNREITEEYVKFYAIIVKISGLGYIPSFCAYAYDNAGNWMFESIEHPSPPVTIKPGFYLFQNVTLPNNYTGFIGKSLIYATFDNS